MSPHTYRKPRLLRFSLIRTRLTLLIVTILVVGMCTFVLTSLVVANTLLQRQDEVRLQQTVMSLSTALAQEPDVNLSSARSELDAFGTPENYLQYQNQQGVPLASSSNLGRLVLPLSQLRSAITANRVDVLVFHGTSFFMCGHAVVTRGQIQGYVLGAHTVADHETLNLVVTLLSIGGGVTLLVLTLLVWLLVRRMLRPLEQLAVSASDIARTSDHALRVQARERPDEINSLAQTMNGMLNSLEAAYRDVQNVNDLQRRFLADVSHELRTPLTIMLSSLDLMKQERGGDPEFQANALESIQLEAERMARMVTQLLILARTDASATLTREPLLVVDIVDDVCRKSRPADSKLNLECRELERVEDAVVLGNADYLKQLFLILLENAFKYTPEGGKVEVIGTLNEDTVAITVADTGIGIAESDRSLVFDRFYRAENARFRSGMGLGLSIAHSVAEQHGGTITLESTVGQGSRFTVTLPLLNRRDMVGERSEREQAHEAEKNGLVGRT
jgi:two-component system, OmpR family, sensor kinase